VRPAEGVGHPVHELLLRRYSGRAFDARPLDDATLASLFEAARWAPSSGNEQPWRFVVVRRGTPAFEAVAATLTGRNPGWARHAATLVVTAARMVRGAQARPNAWAWHDAGMAWAQLALEATSRGLVAHPMGGFDPDGVRAACALPADVAPVSVTALGWPGDPDTLEEPHRTEERAPRTRRPLAELVSEGRFGEPASFLGADAATG
jgi:nitroreductase